MGTKRKRDEVDDELEQELLKEKLFELEEELDEKEALKQEELLKLEMALFRQKQPLYKKREETIAKIPQFWSRTLRHHPLVNALFSSQDKQLFKSLKKVHIERENEESLAVEFEFEENPYLKTLKARKEIIVNKDQENKVAVTALEWKQKDKKSILHTLFVEDEERGNLDLIYEMWEDPIPFFTGTHQYAMSGFGGDGGDGGDGFPGGLVFGGEGDDMGLFGEEEEEEEE